MSDPPVIARKDVHPIVRVWRFLNHHVDWQSLFVAVFVISMIIFGTANA